MGPETRYAAAVAFGASAWNGLLQLVERFQSPDASAAKVVAQAAVEAAAGAFSCKPCPSQACPVSYALILVGWSLGILLGLVIGVRLAPGAAPAPAVAPLVEARPLVPASWPSAREHRKAPKQRKAARASFAQAFDELGA